MGFNSAFKGLSVVSLLKIYQTCVISSFRCEVDKIAALLGCYLAYNGNSLPNFLDNLSLPSSRVKNYKKMGLIGRPETSVKNWHYTPRNNAEKRISQVNISASVELYCELRHFF
jgi:hypothetical protein